MQRPEFLFHCWTGKTKNNNNEKFIYKSLSLSLYIYINAILKKNEVKRLLVIFSLWCVSANNRIRKRTSNRLVASGAEWTSLGMVMDLTVGHTLVNEERPALEQHIAVLCVQVNNDIIIIILNSYYYTQMPLISSTTTIPLNLKIKQGPPRKLRLSSVSFSEERKTFFVFIEDDFKVNSNY